LSVRFSFLLVVLVEVVLIFTHDTRLSQLYGDDAKRRVAGLVSLISVPCNNAPVQQSPVLDVASTRFPMQNNLLPFPDVNSLAIHAGHDIAITGQYQFWKWLLVR